MIYEKKIWGRVVHTFDSPQLGLSQLDFEAFKRCSWHTHLHRDNTFQVISGLILVEHNGGYTLLPPGEVYTVKAGILHRFVSFLPGKMLEAYTPTTPDSVVCQKDIQRFDEGGHITINDLKTRYLWLSHLIPSLSELIKGT